MMPKGRGRARFLAAGLGAILILAAGCFTARESDQVRVAYFAKSQKAEAGHTAQQDALVGRLCLFGEPQHGSNWPHGPTAAIIRPGYVLEHSSLDKIPLWVCEHLGSENLNGSLTRPDSEPFRPDPELASGARSELKDYRGSRYDRGHQAPSGDETKDAQRQRDTYYLSNMVPQIRQFNQHAWKQLETMVRNWAAQRGEAYVITGPIFYDPKEDDTATATGMLHYKAIGNHVAVPTHLYKIVVAHGRDGQWHAIAFVMENKQYLATVDYRTFIRPVRWIEDRSGINFMPELDKPGNEALHQQLERDAPQDIWPAEGPE